MCYRDMLLSLTSCVIVSRCFERLPSRCSMYQNPSGRHHSSLYVAAFTPPQSLPPPSFHPPLTTIATPPLAGSHLSSRP